MWETLYEQTNGDYYYIYMDTRYKILDTIQQIVIADNNTRKDGCDLS